MLNLLMCMDSNYLDKACTMLFSLRRHTKEEATVYLMNHSLQTDEIASFRQYLEKRCKMVLEIVNVQDDIFNAFPSELGHYKIEMYYRILAQFLLPATLDRVLWLDADIIVMKDVAPFYHQEFEDNMLVVCPDSNNGLPDVQNCIHTLGLPEDHVYFNSGVLLMNLEQLREKTKSQEILQQCHSLKDKLTYPDQDLLNVLYANQVKYAPWKQYNYQVGMCKRIPKEDIKQIVILHYTSYKKPWNYVYLTSSSRYYWKVRFKQGDRAATLKAYRNKLIDIIVPAWKEIKDVFF